MLELSSSPSTGWIAQFERPQEVVCLLEIRSNRENLMNQILHTLDSIFAQRLGDKCIIRQWNTRAINLSVSALVDEVTDRLEVGFAVGDVGLYDLEHFLSGFGEFNEDAVVDLQETKELQDLSRFGCHFVNTYKLTMHTKNVVPFNTDDENKFGLSRDVEIPFLLRKTF